MPAISSLSVYHGLQSCLDPLQTNPDDIMKPRVHRWLQHAWVSTGNQASEESRGSIDGLISVNFANKPVLDGASPPPAAYAKQRQSRNSNLDMCTETLGCETGAMCSVYELEIGSVKKKKTKDNSRSTRTALQPEFPPPLTTLRGEARLQLGKKRVEGRLLLIPFKPFVLESERSGGRLLLRILPETEIEKGREGRDEEKLEDKDEDGVEEMGCFTNGGEKKYRRTERCKVVEGGGVARKKIGAAAIFNCDSLWVATS